MVKGVHMICFQQTSLFSNYFKLNIPLTLDLPSIQPSHQQQFWNVRWLEFMNNSIISSVLQTIWSNHHKRNSMTFKTLVVARKSFQRLTHLTLFSLCCSTLVSHIVIETQLPQNHCSLNLSTIVPSIDQH